MTRLRRRAGATSAAGEMNKRRRSARLCAAHGHSCPRRAMPEVEITIICHLLMVTLIATYEGQLGEEKQISGRESRNSKVDRLNILSFSLDYC